LRPSRPSAASLAADRRRGYFPPNQPHQATEGESKPHPSRSLAGVRPPLAAGQPCSAAEDPIVILVFDRGPFLQNDIYRSRVKTLNLVNYVVNGRKIVIMQTQLFWNPCEETELL
jgi:hypothetical protein